MSIKTVKNTIRRVRRSDRPATKQLVKDHLAASENGVRLVESYETAKRKGEIYEYPEGGEIVVKITDEVIA